MKAFVLGAGFGQRLLPITNVVPKPLFPVGNVLLIDYAFKLLKDYGITDVAVNIHHLADKMRAALGDRSRFGMRITLSYEEKILGTGGGLKKMQPFLSDGTFVVLNSDTLIDVDLDVAIAAHRDSGAISTMVLRPAPADKPYGCVDIAKDGSILRIVEDGIEGEAAQSLMFTGVHIMEPRLLEYLPLNTNVCINRYGYTKALKAGERVNSFIYDGFWADAGEPQLYYDLNVMALEGKLQLSYADPSEGFGGEIDNTARVIEPVMFAEGAMVSERASVGPYCVLGKNVHIGSDSHVTNSIVLENTRVPEHSNWDHCIAAENEVLRFGF
jgi:NDP-sugar pyrophosphorylase family protein